MRLSNLFFAVGLALACLALACTHDREDPGMSQSGAPDAGGPVMFMERCDPTDDRCDEGLTCFTFPAKGYFCTHSCTADDECTDPSPGCNNMGVCKAP